MATVQYRPISVSASTSLGECQENKATRPTASIFLDVPNACDCIYLEPAYLFFLKLSKDYRRSIITLTIYTQNKGRRKGKHLIHLIHNKGISSQVAISNTGYSNFLISNSF